MRLLPPLSAVRVFEAAARLENFTAAASELGMTQAAVSYQVKALEERIGAALLGVRHPVHAAMGTGIEPFTQTRGRLGNGVGPGDAAGVEAEVMRARAQPVKKGAVQKSRSA
jgi:hypothetical protein